MPFDLLSVAVAEIDIKNRYFEKAFREGDMRAAVAHFYSPGVRYLTSKLVILEGRSAIEAFFREIHSRITAVEVHPFQTFGDPTLGVIYQLCNTTQHFSSGDFGYGHYTAVFRQEGAQWFCDYEAPAMGWIGGNEPT